MRCTTTVRVGILLSILLMIFACATEDGRDPYALWETFEHEAGAYVFHYAAPPWTLNSKNSENEPNVQIVTVASTTDDQIPAVEAGPLQAKFKAVVTLREHTSAEVEAARDAARLSEEFGENLEALDFKNGRGQIGKILSARLSDRNIRYVYFDVFDERAVVMQLGGRESISGADFTLLLEGLEPNDTGG